MTTIYSNQNAVTLTEIQYGGLKTTVYNSKSDLAHYLRFANVKPTKLQDGCDVMEELIEMQRSLFSARTIATSPEIKHELEVLAYGIARAIKNCASTTK